MFNAAHQPWIHTQLDAEAHESSLHDIFTTPGLVLATGSPAFDHGLWRYLLGIVYSVLGSPQTPEEAPDFAAVADWIDEHAEHFEIGHPQRPFMQAATDLPNTSRSPLLRALPEYGPNRPRIGYLPIEAAPRLTTGADTMRVLAQTMLVSSYARGLGGECNAGDSTVSSGLVHRPEGTIHESLALAWTPVENPGVGTGMWTFPEPEDVDITSEAQMLTALPLRVRLITDDQGRAEAITIPQGKVSAGPRRPDEAATKNLRVGIRMPKIAGAGARDMVLNKAGLRSRGPNLALLVNKSEEAYMPTRRTAVLSHAAQQPYPTRYTDMGSDQGKIDGQYSETIDPADARAWLAELTSEERPYSSTGGLNQDVLSFEVFGRIPEPKPETEDDEDTPVEARYLSKLTEGLDWATVSALAEITRVRVPTYSDLMDVLPGTGAVIPPPEYVTPPFCLALGLHCLGRTQRSHTSEAGVEKALFRGGVPSELRREIKSVGRDCSCDAAVLRPLLVEAYESSAEHRNIIPAAVIVHEALSARVTL